MSQTTRSTGFSALSRSSGHVGQATSKSLRLFANPIMIKFRKFLLSVGRQAYKGNEFCSADNVASRKVKSHEFEEYDEYISLGMLNPDTLSCEDAALQQIRLLTHYGLIPIDDPRLPKKVKSEGSPIRGTVEDLVKESRFEAARISLEADWFLATELFGKHSTTKDEIHRRIMDWMQKIIRADQSGC